LDYDLAFVSEILIFGLMGPLCIGLIIIWMRHLMTTEKQAINELNILNRELENKIIERTAALEQRNAELDKANHELHKLDEMKSEFVSLVSHELRAPLTAINGGLEVALQSADSLPPASRLTLEAMIDESARLTEFVQTILDVSRLEAGRLTLNLGPVAVAPILHRSVEVILGTRRAVKWNLPTEIPPVWADEIHYEQIVRNLLLNADKYSPPKTPIEIKVHVDARAVRVEVTDHGVGIPNDMQQKIFERFQRGQSGESAPPGWGLGLYFAKKLTEAQNGSLILHSPACPERDAPGSSFSIIMPIAADAPEEGDHA
jgi:signal transduction histidine kinase